MKIRFAREFIKLYRKSNAKIQLLIDKRIKLFSEDPYNPSLNNHKLTGNYLGCRSINITGDLRAIYSEMKIESDETIMTFRTLGSHSQLYK